jgi:hypothetical protein
VNGRKIRRRKKFGKYFLKISAQAEFSFAAKGVGTEVVL